jgi:hypothetical protein
MDQGQIEENIEALSRLKIANVCLGCGVPKVQEDGIRAIYVINTARQEPRFWQWCLLCGLRFRDGEAL